MAERGRIYRWPRNRSFGVLPPSRESRLATNPLADAPEASAVNSHRRDGDSLAGFALSPTVAG
jgi:hypothetical protein